MRYITIWIVGLVLIFATSLGCKRLPFAPTAQEDRNAQAQRQCIAQCLDVKAECAHQCSHSCAQCADEENHKMTQRYKQYIHEQNVQGKRLALQLQSFRDPLKCRLASCDCAADYRVCVGQCKQNIRKQLTVKPFCC